MHLDERTDRLLRTIRKSSSALPPFGPSCAIPVSSGRKRNSSPDFSAEMRGFLRRSHSASSTSASSRTVSSSPRKYAPDNRSILLDSLGFDFEIGFFASLYAVAHSGAGRLAQPSAGHASAGRDRDNALAREPGTAPLGQYARPRSGVAERGVRARTPGRKGPSALAIHVGHHRSTRARSFPPRPLQARGGRTCRSARPTT
jgi:hypothetical protein